MHLALPTAALEADRSSPPGSRTRRILAVGVSTFAAAATWLVADLAPGVELIAPTFDATKPATDLSLGAVVAATAVTALLGWLLLAILELATTRPKVLWTTAAIAATIVSLAGPMTGNGVDASHRIVLVMLHLVVSVIYVPLMRRTIETQS